MISPDITETSLDEVWKLRPAYVVDPHKVSYLQDETNSVVHHRCSAFHSGVLWRSDIPGESPGTRLIASKFRATQLKRNEGGEPRPKGLTAFSRVVLQNWEV